MLKMFVLRKVLPFIYLYCINIIYQLWLKVTFKAHIYTKCILYQFVAYVHQHAIYNQRLHLNEFDLGVSLWTEGQEMQISVQNIQIGTLQLATASFWGYILKKTHLFLHTNVYILTYKIFHPLCDKLNGPNCIHIP